MKSTSARIASVMYDAAKSSWHGVVEFFAPGLPGSLAIPVRLEGPGNVPHERLVCAMMREAQYRGIGH